MNFTLTLRSSLLPYISVCVCVCVCVRKPTAAKETTAQKITQSSPAVSESHHWNLSTSIILAPGLLRRFETSPWKGLLAQRSPPSSPVSASSAYAGGVFWSFQFIRNECRNELPLHVWFVGEGEVCLIRPNIWMIAIRSDSNYEARTHPQKHPYTFQLAAEMLNCKAQTNTKDYSNCAQLGDIFALLSLRLYSWLAACSGKQSPASTSEAQSVRVRSAAPNLAVDFNGNLWELCLYKHVGLTIIWIQ